MASASFALGNFHRDNSVLRLKEFQTFMPAQVTKKELLRSDFPHVGPAELVDLRKSNLTFERSELATPTCSLIVDGPLFKDVQLTDAHHDLVMFSFGIVEQCLRREKIVHFLASGSSVLDGRDLDYSVLSDLMGLHTLALSVYPQQHIPVDDGPFLHDASGSNMQSSFRFPCNESLSSRSPVNFGGDLYCDSKMMMHRDGQILSMGSEEKIRALLSTMATVFVSQNATTGVQRHQMVVPYFTRSGSRKRNKTQGPATVKTAVAAPSKSTKEGTMQKKRQKRKAGHEKDAYKNNFSQVCESLLSVILIKKQNGMGLYSLKKHGHELPELLMQLSAGIAGAGLAILFSLVWKLTSTRLLHCSTEVLNAGLGVGMVWLSFAVNMLRETIFEISKHANKLKLKEDEMASKIENSVKEVLFRAAAVMAVVVLRFV